MNTIAKPAPKTEIPVSTFLLLKTRKLLTCTQPARYAQTGVSERRQLVFGGSELTIFRQCRSGKWSNLIRRLRIFHPLNIRFFHLSAENAGQFRHG